MPNPPFLPTKLPKVVLDALGSWGWLAALAIAVIVGLAVVYTRPPRPHEILPSGGPPDPVEHDLDDGRGEGLQRGRSVGATPSKAFPRPDSYFSDRAIKFNYYQAINWSQRGAGDPIEAIVVHVTGPGTCPGMRSWFANPAASASAHFGVCKDGSIEQYVEIGDAAWHAGYINRPDLSNPLINYWASNNINPNRRTVGVEVLLAPGEKLDDFPAMKTSLDLLVQWLVEELNLLPWREYIIGHYQVDSVNRSVDPICCYSVDHLVDRTWAFFNPPPPVVEVPKPVLTIEERIARIEERIARIEEALQRAGIQ